MYFTFEDQVIGEIKMFAGNFAPKSFAFCDGAILRIEDHRVLFHTIGTSFGGDGISTFALPDFRGRMPIGVGQGAGLPNYKLGMHGGSATVVMSSENMPVHTHKTLLRTNRMKGTSASPTGAYPARGFGMVSTGAEIQMAVSAPSGDGSKMNGLNLLPEGGAKPFSILNPYLAIQFIISLEGEFQTPG